MESLARTFQHELKKATKETYQTSIQSFLNLWSYEYDSFEHIPKEIEKHLYASDYAPLFHEE